MVDQEEQQNQEIPKSGFEKRLIIKIVMIIVLVIVIGVMTKYFNWI